MRIFESVRRVPRAIQLAFLAMLVAAPIAYGATGGLVQTTDANGNGAWQTGSPGFQLPDTVYALFDQTAGSTTASGTVFVAPNDGHTYQVAFASLSFLAPAIPSGSGTMQVEVAGAGVANGSGTNQLSAGMSLTGAAATVVNGTLIASPTAFAAGSRVNLVQGGSSLSTLANLHVDVVIKRIS